MSKKKNIYPIPQFRTAAECRAWLVEKGFELFTDWELFISPQVEVQEFRQCHCGGRSWLPLKTIRLYKDEAIPVDVFVVCANKECRQLCALQ